MFHEVGVKGHARRAVPCALVLAAATVLMQCAHGQPGTGEQPSRLAQPLAAEARVFRDCPDCPEMVEIPGGTFRMGLADWWTTPWGTDTRVRPVHTVTVRPFAIGLREVTSDEYAVFAEATGRTPSGCGWRPAGNGARCLTWHDARAYAEWLTSRSGRLYRLPSESEWEYVARGSDLDGMSRFGVENLFTDAREWMADCYYPNYQGAPTDGSPWVEDSDCPLRAVRGRSGLWPSEFHRRTMLDRRKRELIERAAAGRGAWQALGRASTIGVRIARALVDSPEP